VEVKDILKNHSYFSSLTETELSDLEEIIIQKNYKRDEIIFFEDEPGIGLFLIIKGKVKLAKITADGKEQILHILQKGDLFAEVVLFDQGNYPATAVALEDSCLGIIKRDKIESLIKRKPSIAIKLLNVMGRRLRRAQERIGSFGIKNSSSRLASIIVYQGNKYGQKLKGGIKISLALTQEELSNIVGVSRETISRILKKFEKKGLLEVKRKQIIIKDLENLKNEI
jgi:CRP/FNR family transcriptional regulator